MFDSQPMFDELKRKVQTLSENAWEHKANWPEVQKWLDNFNGEFSSKDEEQLHALYLLTQSMYFGQELIREMLRAVYAQLYRYPAIRHIRKHNNDTLDPELIEREFTKELNATRFLGVGNPSESGTHILYYFRQVNELKKELFVNGAEMLSISRDANNVVSIKQRDSSVKRYVFIDDLLGSGTQIRNYLAEILEEIRQCNPDIETHYFSLFATSHGLEEARRPDLFGTNVECVFELDDSFKCFSDKSRCFASTMDIVKKDVARNVAEGYGNKLCPDHPLGYKDGQLLLALSHNTPDNSLPILWFDFPKRLPWAPIFRRFDKNYS